MNQPTGTDFVNIKIRNTKTIPIEMYVNNSKVFLSKFKLCSRNAYYKIFINANIVIWLSSFQQ